MQAKTTNFYLNNSNMATSPDVSLSPRFKAIGLLFDAISGIISLLDLTTDIVIMLGWYMQGRMTFFWISFAILMLAQLSYLGIFYLNHGVFPSNRREVLRTLLSCLCTLPFTPLLSFIFYLVSDDASCLRRLIDRAACFHFAWHQRTVDVHANPTRQYLEDKLYKSLGFLMEAIIEAFPQRSHIHF